MLLFAPLEMVAEATVGGCVACGGDGDDVERVGGVVCPLEVEGEVIGRETQRLAGNGDREAVAIHRHLNRAND